jgi:hypothetical protein
LTPQSLLPYGEFGPFCRIVTALHRLTYSRGNRLVEGFSASYGETERDLRVAYPAEQIATRDNRHELRRHC